ncbi:hypothetical protein HDF24_14665 [Mucilaginibacter sp. X4EP1]|uniref:hypothetical protein n=1 Tax=Mucilaginibacter sp. X4EP1 TaxID=2723092 RepID=UPI0021680043|nr:hypothetical protein [Mucilaginibacter sp. X4EP1]MCS3815464.1 flagellar biosynthesis GTPase FlhF [Mucilaginibacter sp. X4EP1]
MKTEVIESKKVNTNEVKDANPVTEENKNPKFVAGNAVNKESAKVEAKPEAEKAKEAPKAVAPKTEEVKAEAPKAQEQAKPQAEQSKAEPKAEHFKPEPAKPVLNLEGTLKLVEELHRRKIQRDKLLETINNLDAFEFDLKEEMDETGGNVYQGCVLTIEDDNRQKFTTKNPTIIWTVAQMVNRLCVDKLAEIEAGIMIPA